MYNKGFTLIELLVVVLIIGILAAVAVPQYTKIITKSRSVEGHTWGSAFWKSQLRYYQMNGQYTTDPDALDVSVPPELIISKGLGNIRMKYFDISIRGTEVVVRSLGGVKLQPIRYEIAYSERGAACRALTTDTDGMNFCKAMSTQTPVIIVPGWNDFPL